MQKQWYLIYTRPKCEKRVAALLTKKKIENFYPLNCRHIKEYRVNKIVYEPLFDAYVFAKMETGQIAFLKQLNSVINLVYWKSQPVIIGEEEVQAIREFAMAYTNIQLERTPVNLNGEVGSIHTPSYFMDGNVLTLKNKSKKVSLPSMGYMMVAEMGNDAVMGREIGVGEKVILLQ